jgi:hypothetical protein
MKKDSEDQSNEKEHGIISVVQSTDDDENEPDMEAQSDEQKKHGVISTVQAPDESEDYQR